MAEEKPSEAPTSAGAAKPFVDQIDRIRKRADLTAKLVGGLGTSAVTAIGIAKFADVFPWPPGAELAATGLFLGFLGMGIVVAVMTARLWRVNAPIVLKADLDQMDDLDSKEREFVRPVYERIATLNQAMTLRDYEERRFRLVRAAERVGDDLAARLRARAAEISSDITATEARAGMIVVRRRATNAVADLQAGAFYATFAVSVILFGVSADRLDSERSGRISTAKACAEAGVTGGALPPICADVRKSASAKPTTEEQRRQAAEALGTALGKCAAVRPVSGDDRCATLARAYAANR